MIPVISDSHIPRRAESIPDEFMRLLNESELAVHCGDFVAEDYKGRLEQKTDLIAVKGNCDFFDLPSSQIFERNGYKTGVYHGSGITPRGHYPTLLDVCEKLDVDILLHGHTHRMEAVKKDGKLLLNPGSCTGVGGGSASPGNPTMLKLHFEAPIKVEKVELKSGQLKTSEETFNL